MLRVSHVMAASIVSLASFGVADAGIVTYLDDVSGWSDAAGSTTIVDFVPSDGVPQVVSGLFYKDLGITLSWKWSNAPKDWYLNVSPFAMDGFQGHLAYYPSDVQSAINFDSPIQAFAMDKFVATTATVQFYLSGSLIESGSISVPGLGSLHFFGWKTDFQFDRVVLSSGPQGVADNIYFSTIPAPGGAVLIGLAGLFGGSRGRRRP